jgi:hypothetical protein
LKWRERGIVKALNQNTKVESFGIISVEVRQLFLIGMAALLLYGLTAIGASAQAKNIYITPDGGGAGNCTSNTHPPSWFNSSTNWGSGPTQIGSGTIVLICGAFQGGNNVQFFVFQSSGSPGQPISLVFDSNASIKATYVSSDGAIKTNAKSYITIDGGSNGVIQNTANKTGQSHSNSTAISALGGHDVEIKNLHILDIYDKTSFADTSVDQTQMICVNFNGSNARIHDNVMLNSGWCLNQNYTNDSNVQIYNNEIGFMDHGVACAGANFVVSDEHIHDNHFHDMSNWDTPSDSYHHDGIHCYNGSGGKIQNLYLYNNLFDGNEGTCCVTAWIFLEGGSSGSTPWTDSTGTLYMWNNVILGSLDLPNGQLVLNRGTGHQIINNSFILTGPPNGGTAIRSQDNGGSGHTITLKNNAFSGSQQVYSFSSDITSVIASNNAYAGITPGGNSVFEWTTHASTNSFSQWQSGCGCDSNSLGSLGSSLGVNSLGIFQTGSMLVGVGANLSSMATGNLSSLLSDTSAGDTRTPSSRPTGGSWTIGAYGSQSSAVSAPVPPTGLNAIVN